jgi:hypothetical protein
MAEITVTYNPDATGTPSQRIEISPQPAVAQGRDVSLIWKPVNCTFPDKDAIVFQPDSVDPTPWPYAQPAPQADGTYTLYYQKVATYVPTTYNYNVSVISEGGTTYFRADPDVTNTPE